MKHITTFFLASPMLFFIFLFSYNLCKKYDSKWICDNKIINNINCCKCNKLNETFYFEIGCSDSSPQDICINTGGSWIDSNSSPSINKCICPQEYSFNPKDGCFK